MEKELNARDSPVHVVWSSGGTQATIDGTGGACALYLAACAMRKKRLKLEFASFGGISGGATPALLMASEMTPSEMVDRVINSDLSQLFRVRKPFGRVQSLSGLKLPSWANKGLIDSSGYGKLILSVIENWPERFWTMASSKGVPLLFNSRGSFTVEHIDSQGSLALKQVSSIVAPLDVAICASVAIPGLIKSVEYEGLQLYDGALSPFGHCPHEVPVVERSASSKDIICFEIAGDIFSNRVLPLGRIMTGGNKRIEQCAREYQGSPPDNDRLVISLPRWPVNSLDFTISTEVKQQILLSGFRHSCAALNKAGLLTDLALAEAMSQSEQWSDFEELLRRVDQDLSTPETAPLQMAVWQERVTDLIRKLIDGLAAWWHQIRH